MTAGPNDQATVEQAPQAGANPAAPAGEGEASPVQDTAPPIVDDPALALETPPAGDDGATPEAPPSGDPAPGGVPPDAAATGTSGGDTPPMLVIQGPAQGRWRIGRRFGPEPTHIPSSELSNEELAALRADPLLMIGVV